MPTKAYILASTLGIDSADMKDYRYQPTRTPFPLWALGDHYYTVSPTKPRNYMGLEWVEYRDQFFASSSNTKVWIAPME